MDHSQARRAPVRWAARVSRPLIVRMYEADARGVRDEELVDQVGCALYARCRSILAATEAQSGRITCPGCGSLIAREGREPTLVCRRCGWRMEWTAFRNSYKGQHLMTGGARPAFEGYLARFDAARGYRDKILAVDALIHAFHYDSRGNPSAPAARNVIEGSVREVLDLLEGLAYGIGSEAGLADAGAAYQETVVRSAGRGHLRRPNAGRDGLGP